MSLFAVLLSGSGEIRTVFCVDTKFFPEFIESSYNNTFYNLAYSMLMFR